MPLELTPERIRIAQKIAHEFHWLTRLTRYRLLATPDDLHGIALLALTEAATQYDPELRRGHDDWQPCPEAYLVQRCRWALHKFHQWLRAGCRNPRGPIAQSLDHVATDCQEYVLACLDSRVALLESQEHFDHLLKFVSPRQAQVLRLHFVEGLSYREISELLGLACRTASAVGHEGITRLRDLLAPGSDGNDSTSSPPDPCPPESP